MKKHIFFILICFILTASCIYYVPYGQEGGPPPEEEYYEEEYADPSAGLDVSYFYDYLSPHGIWIYHPTYRYVWVPSNMPYGWRPYTQGHWVWTDYGWTWHSQIIWGWAPFHYGRWGWDNDFGWFWMPGTIWGPGWVTWRSSSLYIGWAPLPPESRFVVGIGIKRLHLSLPASHWIFVDGDVFLSPHINRHVFPYERNITIINYTIRQTNIYVHNGRVINEGLDINRVQRLTRKKVSKYELKDTENAELRRLGPENLEVYRPKIRKSRVTKPKTVVNRTEAKKRISKAKIKEETKPPLTEESSLKDAQNREIKLLKKSQQKEIKELEKKSEEEKTSAKTPAEKKKVEKYYKTKVTKLKKSHETEKSQIKKRHEKESKKATKKKVEKKQVKKKEKK